MNTVLMPTDASMAICAVVGPCPSENTATSGSAASNASMLKLSAELATRGTFAMAGNVFSYRA